MFYNDILDKCRYSEKLTFEKEQYTHERRNRGRNIIWYNPPFSKNVKKILRNNFYTYKINILVEIINITRSSILTMSKLVIVAWIM